MASASATVVVLVVVAVVGVCVCVCVYVCCMCVCQIVLRSSHTLERNYTSGARVELDCAHPVARSCWITAGSTAVGLAASFMLAWTCVAARFRPGSSGRGFHHTPSLRDTCNVGRACVGGGGRGV